MNEQHVSGYADRTARLVPGLGDLHRMTGLLLAERAPADARVLVLGAGGGMELRALAEMQPAWRFASIHRRRCFGSPRRRSARSPLASPFTKATFTARPKALSTRRSASWRVRVRDVELFYAAFTFKGWVGYRA
jgi:hypothetical protein